MKKLINALLIVMILFSFSEINAQMSGGAGVAYGTNINNIGLSLNGKYEFNETLSAAPSFTYFFKKDFITWSALDLDVNYQLSLLENIGSLYAIGGLNMTFFKIKYDYDFGDLGGVYDGSVTGSNAGLNLGLGLIVPAGEKMSVAPEIKLTVGGANYLRAGAKIMFGL
ncbi:MAG: hypothetical protein K9H49_09645 [Bacteroidales bacterium]|nr:hypothetical protein [Bacteroidales bacterium]MCF8389918.1 hypothetical protein [Bacteroidales bacterium]